MHFKSIFVKLIVGELSAVMNFARALVLLVLLPLLLLLPIGYLA